MKAQQYSERSLETAWREIELEIIACGMMEPKNGFPQRFKQRLSSQREAEQRRQAWIFIGINVISAISLLVMIAVFYMPSLTGPSDLLIKIAGLFSRFTLHVQMISGCIFSLARTLPNIVPVSWWASILICLSVLSILWFSLMRPAFQKPGVIT